MVRRLGQKIFIAMMMVGTSYIAIAQDTETSRTDEANAEQVKDPVPVPPKISGGEPPGIKQQAGIGGQIAYAEAGVIEMGGLFSIVSAKDYTEISLVPQLGYFFADNLQISALASWAYSKLEIEDDEDAEQSVGTILLEPSVHMPLTNSTFVFAGLGAGWLLEKGEKPGMGIAPRIGYKSLVGRSGMLTLALQAVYGLNKSDVQTTRGTVLTVKEAYNMALGYTVLL